MWYSYLTHNATPLLLRTVECDVFQEGRTFCKRVLHVTHFSWLALTHGKTEYVRSKPLILGILSFDGNIIPHESLFQDIPLY